MTITTETAREAIARITAYGTPEAAWHSIHVDLTAIRPYTSRDLSRAADALATVITASPEHRAARLADLHALAQASPAPSAGALPTMTTQTPGTCYADHSDAATTTAADRSALQWQTTGPCCFKSESQAPSHARYGMRSELPPNAEAPRSPARSPDFCAGTSNNPTAAATLRLTSLPPEAPTLPMTTASDAPDRSMIHLTLTGSDVGRPFCDCDKPARRTAGDTFAHVPYTNAEAFLARPDICPTCLAEWNAAGDER